MPRVPAGRSAGVSDVETRPCGTRSDHVPHPWNGGRRRCKGFGKYAEDNGPRPTADVDDACGDSYTGPTGIVWDCAGREHPTDPNAGIAGSGHTWRARPRLGLPTETLVP